VKNYRIIAPTVLFLLLSAVGTVWLIGVARGPSAASPRFEEVGGDPGGGTTTAATDGSSVPSVASADPGATTAGPAATSTAPTGARSATTTGGTRTSAPATAPAGAPPIPSRAIRVGGVTLDDTSPRTHCYLARNTDFDEPVRITRIAVSNAKVVVKPDLCAGTSAPGEDQWTPTFACQAGSVLQPGGDGCYTGIEPASASLEGELRSTMTLTLRARCTSATGHPCGDSGSPAPTRARPVDVTWTETYDGTLCYLAGGEPPNGIFC
jgi:hypothetical protein